MSYTGPEAIKWPCKRNYVKFSLWVQVLVKKPIDKSIYLCGLKNFIWTWMNSD